MVGTVLKDRYEIIVELAKGGMSTVYLAKDRILDSYWAVKQVRKGTNIDIEAFKKEVELLSTLNHPDVPRIVDRIEDRDSYFVCMDFIDGIPLSKKVKSEGPQPEEEVIRWAKLLCDILNYLHSVKNNPIVYRDMKPDNIMLSPNGRVKLIDFGIAKECIRGKVQIGPRVGTKGYAAPEQYMGEMLDERTDIYSLGVTLFYLVTGINPGKPPNAVRPIRQINPFLSEGLEYIINKCTQQDPSNRYKNCEELKEDLENIKTLNSQYRKSMKKKLTLFCTSISLFALSIISIFVGKHGINKEILNKYQYTYNIALKYEQDKNYEEAKEQLIKSLEYKPTTVDPYMKFFNLLLPKKEDKEFIIKTKYAIDTIKQYVDNKYSPMYNNATLMYNLIKKCIDVNDPKYAQYAVTYINALKSSSDYKEGKFSRSEIDNLYVIANNCSKDLETQNFIELRDSLLALENYTKTEEKLSLDHKLNNYYTLIIIYNTYPNKLQGAYDKIFSLGNESKSILEANFNNETINFNYIIPMYEIIASNLYNSAMVARDIDLKRKMLKESLIWFGYLEDLNDDLNEELELKKANSYKALFDTYNRVDELNNMDNSIYGYLDKASKIYENILLKNPSNFLAGINLTKTYLDMELTKDNLSERNFTNTINLYNQVLKLKNENKNMSSADLSQFSSLKQQMQIAGIGE